MTIGAKVPWNGREETGGRGNASGGKTKNDGARRTNPSIGEIDVQKRKRTLENKLIIRMTKTKTNKANEKLAVRITKNE